MCYRGLWTCYLLSIIDISWQAQFQKIKITQDNEQKSLFSVIGTLRKDLQNLQGESNQYRSEIQRQKLIVSELQQENIALKNHLRKQQVKEV